MKVTKLKKTILGIWALSSLISISGFANEKNETKEGFIPQMMDQVKGSGFALTNKESSAVLEISGSRLSPGPKILLTFHFGT